MSLRQMSLNPIEFRRAMGGFATGVTIITVDLEGEVHGMTANAFASVSLDPTLVLVCVDHSTRTHAHLHAKKRFRINVLCANQRGISGVLCVPCVRMTRMRNRAVVRLIALPMEGAQSCMEHWAYFECRLHSAQPWRPYDLHRRGRGCRCKGGGSPVVLPGDGSGSKSRND